MTKNRDILLIEKKKYKVIRKKKDRKMLGWHIAYWWVWSASYYFFIIGYTCKSSNKVF